MHLSQMQDLAGIRIMLSSRDEQDEFVRKLVGAFSKSRVKDRRLEPQHGYRAVHVIVRVEKVSVEIQVRTFWQHFWAERFERIGDLVGREIRYGLPPAKDSPAVRRVLDVMRRLSEAIDVFERDVSVAAASRHRDNVIDELIEVWRELFRPGI